MTCFLHEKACKGTAKKSNIQIFGQKSATFLLFSFIFRNFAPTFNKNVCMPTKERNRSIDILRAIAIILVVFAHMFPIPGGAWLSEHFHASSYRLAIFLFISGYLFRDIEWANYGRFVWQKTKNLIIPFIGWNIAYAGIVSLINLRQPVNYLPTTSSIWSFHPLFIEPFISGHQYTLNLATWFVGMLFIALVIYALLHLFTKRLPNWAILIIYLLIACLGLYSARFDMPARGWVILQRTAYALFFIQFGRCFRLYIEPLLSPRKLWWILLSILPLWYCVMLGSGNSYSLVWMQYDGAIFRPIIAGIFGCVFWMIASMQIAQLIPKNKIETAISNSTWSIMTNHIFVRFMLCWLYIYFAHDITMQENFRTNVWFLPKSVIFYYVAIILEIVLPVLWQLGFDRFKEHARSIFRTLTNHTK